MMYLERETGIEPATNGLGSRDSTTELLPPVIDRTAEIVTLQAVFKNLAAGGPASYSELAPGLFPSFARSIPHCIDYYL
jgi:hypothetical protein